MAEVFSIIFHLLVIAASSYFLYLLSSEAFKPFYWPALLLKIIAGIAYGLLYTFYFTYGDTFSYYNEASEMADYGLRDFGGYLRLLFFDSIPDQIKLSFTLEGNPRAYWFSKIISPILLITAKNYWITAAYLSLFSFFGIKSIAETLLKIFPNNTWTIVISFFLFPSFVLWSAGLTKESLAIGSLFYMISICLLSINQYKITSFQIVLFLLFFWIEYKVRFFYLAAFLLTIGLFTIITLINSKLKLTAVQKFIMGAVLLLIFIAGISQMDFTLGFVEFPEYLLHAYNTDFNKHPANAIIFYQLKPTYQSIVINSPLALVSGLFRPSFLDVTNVPMILVALENFILFILFTVNFKKHFSKSDFLKVLWIYILILALFLAIASPNFGSLTRYKVAILPFILFLVLKDNGLVEKLVLVRSKKPSKT